MENAQVSWFPESPATHYAPSQSDLNIEHKTRSSLFSWTGQFSPQFVETMLGAFARKGDLIVDPFAGSGTTLCEAARKGLAAYGTELNVSAYHMAKTYELVSWTPSERQHLLSQAGSVVASISEDQQALPSLLGAIREDPHSPVSDLLNTLVILLDLFTGAPSMRVTQTKWAELCSIVDSLPFSKAPVHVERGNARNLQLADGEGTLLFTSPPYINVMNYHQKFRRSVEALGYDVLAIARGEIGSNRKNRSNRFLTVVQYCVDMAVALREGSRVCQKGARMIYVVGRESTVLGHAICNSRLVTDLAAFLGMPLIAQQERVFRNRYGQSIYEDILHFRNEQAGLDLENSLLEEEARKIAVRTLTQIESDHPESENADPIRQAIRKAQSVRRSEVHCS